MSDMTDHQGPFGFNRQESQAFGEYILREQKKGRTELGMDELGHVVDAIKIAFETFGR